MRFRTLLIACGLVMLSLPASAGEWQTLDRQFASQYRSGNYAAAKTSAEQALAVARKQSDSARQVTSLNALALTHQALGELAQAQTLLEQTLALATKNLPANHANLTAIRKNLDSVKDARRHQQTTNTLQQAQSLNDQGLALHEREQYAEAAGFYQQALPILEQHFGGNSVQVARVLGNLADTHSNRKQYDDAETLYLRALAIYETQPNEKHARAATLNALAANHYLQRRFRQAEPLFLRALEALEAEFGTESPELLLVLDNLEALYQSTGRTRQAQEMRQRSTLIRRTQDQVL